MINLAAAARSYLAAHGAAARWRLPDAPETVGRGQALAALTTAEELWNSLTGETGQDAMDLVERLAAAGSDSVLLQFTGVDPGNTDTQMLVTIWQDGSAEVAYRDTSGGTWGPPHPLDPA